MVPHSLCNSDTACVCRSSDVVSLLLNLDVSSDVLSQTVIALLVILSILFACEVGGVIVRFYHRIKKEMFLLQSIL